MIKLAEIVSHNPAFAQVAAILKIVEGLEEKALGTRLHERMHAVNCMILVQLHVF